jgi:hypothetical protein
MTTLTWDEVPPRRPVLADFQTGGVAYANDDRPGFAPPTDSDNPGTGKFPTANWANQVAGQWAAFGRLCFSLIVDIEYDGTTPYVARAVTPGAWLDDLNPRVPGSSPLVGSDSPLTVAESAAGDVNIFWPAASLPSGTTLTMPPMLGVHGSTAASIVFGGFLSSPPDVGIRVLTFSTAPAGVRAPFTFAFVL